MGSHKAKLGNEKRITIRISSAIKKHMYIAIHPFFGADRYRLKYSNLEDVGSIGEIKHPIIKACLERVRIPPGMEIASIADIPAGTGLGSSSSFTVGLLNALNAYRGNSIPKWELAEQACDIEINQVGSPIGKQDQFAAATGGLNIFRFQQDGAVITEPVRTTEKTIKKLETQLRLYYLGGSRDANKLLREQSSTVGRDKKEALIGQMVGMVDTFKGILEDGDLASVGPMLDEAWQRKKELSEEVSSSDIDDTYKFAIENGATGGKLLGAGGNGFLLICHNDHGKLSEQLKLPSIPFEVDLDGTIVSRMD